MRKILILTVGNRLLTNRIQDDLKKIKDFANVEFKHKSGDIKQRKTSAILKRLTIQETCCILDPTKDIRTICDSRATFFLAIL